MIDFDKLNKAKTLIKELSHKGWFLRQNVLNCFDENEAIEEVTYMLCHRNEYDEEFDDIDELIAKLRDLKKPAPKYKKGDEVWFIDYTDKRSAISRGNVMYSEYRQHLFGQYKYYVCVCDGYYIPEDCLYPSLKQLIEAQISYWVDLRKRYERGVMIR